MVKLKPIRRKFQTWAGKIDDTRRAVISITIHYKSTHRHDPICHAYPRQLYCVTESGVWAKPVLANHAVAQQLFFPVKPRAMKNHWRWDKGESVTTWSADRLWCGTVVQHTTVATQNEPFILYRARWRLDQQSLVKPTINAFAFPALSFGSENST